MSDKILEAVKALGGDISNSLEYRGTEVSLIIDREGDYVCIDKGMNILESSEYICTISEFNTYAEQWLKEAYMHNAALDFEFEPNKVAFSSGRFLWLGYNYFGSDDDLLKDGKFVNVCKMQEFIDYCNSNKPCEEVKPEWDGEGLPPIGASVEFSRRASRIATGVTSKWNDGDTIKIIALESVCDSLLPVAWHSKSETASSVTLDCIQPIKSPRDKAVEEMQRDCKQGGNKLVIGLCRELYDAGYRKITPKQPRYGIFL